MEAVVFELPVRAAYRRWLADFLAAA